MYAEYLLGITMLLEQFWMMPEKKEGQVRGGLGPLRVYSTTKVTLSLPSYTHVVHVVKGESSSEPEG